MPDYQHHVSGFFVEREKAEMTVSRLVDRGFPRERLHVFDAEAPPQTRAPESDTRETLKDVVSDGAVGAAVGTGLGALGQLALTAANVSLFVASPLIGPLAMLGWGASLGALVGAAAGAEKLDVSFSALIRDAVSSGQVVLVADTRSEQESATASEVIQQAVREYDATGPG
jgi:hypothetical protein